MKRYFLPFYGIPCCEKFSFEKLMHNARKTNLLIEAQSAKQSELLVVFGKTTQKQSAHLQGLWAEFIYPAYCIHIVGCKNALDTYSTCEDLSEIIDVDVAVPSCEVKAEQIKDALFRAQKRKT